MEVELIAVDGLDDAIVGTTFCNRVEVLCYDYDKAVQLAMHGNDMSEADAELLIADLAVADVVGKPLFIHFYDNNSEYDGLSASATLH